MGAVLDQFKDDPKIESLLAWGTEVEDAEMMTVFVSRGYNDNLHDNAALIKAISQHDADFVDALLNPPTGIPSDPNLI